MQLRDIRLLPSDATREQIADHLTASPDWTLTGTGANTKTLIYRYDAEDGAHRVFIPRDDNPAYAEDDQMLCANAVISINAVALGLSPMTNGKALARLVEIADLIRGRDTSGAVPTLSHVYAVATGQAATR